jgi:hypothetical protein
MRDLTSATITKAERNSIIKREIVDLIKEAKRGLTLLEIRTVIDKADRKLMRELVEDNEIKIRHHFLKNSDKVFTHTETKKVDKIKGTRVNRYEIVEKGNK